MSTQAVTRPTPQLVELTPKEAALLYFLRGIAYGSVTVFMQGNQPVRVEKAVESKVL